MAILVCGGAGYIGSHFIRKLIDEKEEIVVVDSLITGHRESVPKNIPFYNINIIEKDKLKEVFESHNIEAVVHFAASSIVPESIEKPLMYFKNNFCATESLLEVMEEFKVNKLIFSSTAAVYGNPSVTPINEEISPNPTNTYGESKLAMEKMIKWQANTGKLSYCALRYFNVAGASLNGEIGEDHNPETHIIPLAIRAAINNKEFKIFGSDFPTKDGTCVRDYIHVVDLVEAHYLALKYLRLGGISDIFNLGYGEGYSNLEIVKAIKEVTGINFRTIMSDRRKGDPPILVADSKKAKKTLKWIPKHNDLKSIISTAFEFIKSHPKDI